MMCRHIIFIEEAHNIIGVISEAKPSEENADPKAYATEFICRMMAECGGDGVPIVIIDQLPSALSPAVLKHAGSLLLFRETHEEDRQVSGSAMLATEGQKQDMGRLRTGEAYVYTEGYYQPQRIRTVNIHALLKFDKRVSDQKLLGIIREESWFRQMAQQRITMELSQLQEYMDDFEVQRIATIGEIKRIVARRQRLLALNAGAHDQRQLLALRSQLRSIRQRLEHSFRQFHQRIYQRYMPAGEDLEASLRPRRDQLRDRFESVIRPDVEKELTFTDDLFGKFMDPKSKETDNAKKE